MRLGNVDLEGLANMAMFGRVGSGGGSAAEIACFVLLVAVVKMLASPDPPLWLTNIVDVICFRTTDVSVRVISHRRVSTYAWGMTDDNDGSHNRLLQKAVMCHINGGGFEWPLSHASLVRNSEAPGRGDRDRDRDGDGGRENKPGKSIADRYRVLTMPPYDQWVRLQGGVWFKRHKTSSSESDGKRSEETEHYYLRGANRDIDSYVAESLASYDAFLDDGRDDTRYMYVPFRKAEGERRSLAYKRYPLSDARAFDTLYIPEKESVLRLVEQFSKKEGKFAVPGYPNKLGFLLHGPPGTGKTSFIKALASHTKRHVVSISLDKIRTNQELMSMVYDRKYCIEDDDVRHEMDFKDVVFVMEDVDAAGTAVAKRSADPRPPSQMAEATKVAAAAITLAGSGSPGAANNPFAVDDDALNLAGILNVLDGVLDSPERIVVMTTNHPEKLDPALVRPGRINMEVRMSYIRPAEALKMLRRYFGDGVSGIDAGLLDVLEHADVSPARLEAMCGQHATIKTLLEELNS